MPDGLAVAVAEEVDELRITLREGGEAARPPTRSRSEIQQRELADARKSALPLPVVSGHPAAPRSARSWLLAGREVSLSFDRRWCEGRK